MERMLNLRDLLQHEIDDLCSAEEQIIRALPEMIEQANNLSLKQALNNHLLVTLTQKNDLTRLNRYY